jgi:hypothetical protein
LLPHHLTKEGIGIQPKPILFYYSLLYINIKK